MAEIRQTEDPQQLAVVDAATGARHINDQVDDNSDLVGFFLVGAIINLVLVGAYIAWAIRQWRNKKR